MVIENIKIVQIDKVIENGYIEIASGLIKKVGSGKYHGSDKVIDGQGKIAFPGFIDIHVHGSCNIDFMDAKASDYKIIEKAFYSEGITSFLATTLTSDTDSLINVCKEVKMASKEVKSLAGIHFEGPYIAEPKKGAQNAAYIRNASIDEIKMLNDASGNMVRYISLAPEKEGALEFIKEASKINITCSAGHTCATFKEVEKAIECGLTNTTHTHNAMSGYDSRNPGVLAASMYFDSLYTECICDGIHVCFDTLKTFYKIVGEDRFVIVTDSLKAKHSDIEEFELFGLPCERKNGAAYLKTGPLAGSLLLMDQAIRNVKEATGASLIALAKISSTNAAKSLHLADRGEIKEGLLADIVLMDDSLHIDAVYKLGEKVF